jgi:hypothetical protein
MSTAGRTQSNPVALGRHNVAASLGEPSSFANPATKGGRPRLGPIWDERGSRAHARGRPEGISPGGKTQPLVQSYHRPALVACAVFLLIGGAFAISEGDTRDAFVAGLGSVVGLFAVGNGVHVGARHLAGRRQGER